MKNKQKWVLGVSILVIIVVAVVFANPKLQKGFLNISQLAPSKTPTSLQRSLGVRPDILNQNAARNVSLPECTGRGDYEVRVLYSPYSYHDAQAQANGAGWVPFSTSSLSSSKLDRGREVLGEFAIIPQGCKLTINTLDFTWYKLVVRDDHFEDYIIDPSIRVFRGENRLNTNMTFSQVCFIDSLEASAPTFTAYTDATPIIISPGQPYTSFVISGEPITRLRNAVRRAEDRAYKLSLEKINGAVPQSGARSSYEIFLGREPNNERANYCRS